MSKSDKRTNALSTRVNDECIKIIEDKAKDMGITKTTLARIILEDYAKSEGLVKRLDRLEKSLMNSQLDIVAEVVGLSEQDIKIAQDSLNDKYQDEIFV